MKNVYLILLSVLVLSCNKEEPKVEAKSNYQVESMAVEGVGFRTIKLNKETGKIMLLAPASEWKDITPTKLMRSESPSIYSFKLGIMEENKFRIFLYDETKGLVYLRNPYGEWLRIDE